MSKPSSASKLAPVLSGFLGFLFGVGCYLAESSSLGRSLHSIYWSLVFCIQVATGVLVGWLFKRLYLAAYTDGLTGLLNYRSFYASLEQHLLQSNPPCGLIYLDLDDFKSINDTHGHQIGDDTLRQLAQVLQQSCRSSDIIARLGGDEFAILLPNLDQREALSTAESIRYAAELQLSRYGATVSVGIAISWPGANANRMIALADRALYRAKEGKNQVVCPSSVSRDVV